MSRWGLSLGASPSWLPTFRFDFLGSLRARGQLAVPFLQDSLVANWHPGAQFDFLGSLRARGQLAVTFLQDSLAGNWHPCDLLAVTFLQDGLVVRNQ